jgi:hypothetical protein
MTWDVQWSVSAEQQLRNIPSWKTAERVARAVHRFAAAGVGTIENVPGRPGELRLIVKPFEVRFSLDVAARAVRVWAVYRR